jgi:peroxiredoxin Q/BCP
MSTPAVIEDTHYRVIGRPLAGPGADADHVLSLAGELLSDGQVVLFFFPLARSPIRTAQACHFRDLGHEFAVLGAQRVGISSDTVDRQALFAEQRAFDYPLLSDAGRTVSEQFGVRRGIMFSRRDRATGQGSRGGRHIRRRGLLARMLPTRRTTFVIDTDRTVLKVVSSELRASVHADLALWFLRNHYLDKTNPPSPRVKRRRGEF